MLYKLLGLTIMSVLLSVSSQAQRLLFYDNNPQVQTWQQKGDAAHFAKDYKTSVRYYDSILTISPSEEARCNQIMSLIDAKEYALASAKISQMMDTGFFKTVQISNYKSLPYEVLVRLDLKFTQNYNTYVTKNNIKYPDLVWRIFEMYELDQYYQRITAFKAQYDNAYPEFTQEEVTKRQLETFDSSVSYFKYYFFPRYGYLWNKDIGTDATHYMWVMVQHGDRDVAFQEAYLVELEKAVAKKEASGKDLAYLTDRVRKNTNRPQVYGTQMKYRQEKQADGTSKIIMEPYTVENPELLDARRAKVGLMPMKDYLDQMNKVNNR
ncbi:hypothetical protein LX64_01513 [Chitinophaga skermanii]|uniref:Tetratricopeptide repeat protein n=1 Tax=Chitinophaga skermanii TaxID=331697 RepID=A0A327QW79_9BACT|nr:DUF6624 domain-containing protein [Chitinophaga skermanii]RAJ08859.1 hypothetical protein LX64_01513 [Chitinophaga skermanii]